MSEVAITARLIGLVRLSRPAFLVGGVAFYLLGAGMAHSLGADLDLGVLVLGLLAISGAQLATHFSNEYFDLAADLMNPTPTRWAGGSRVLPEGLLRPRTALFAAIGGTAVSLAATGTLWLALGTGPLTLPLLLSALALGWSYSAPPLQLEASGLGEVDVAVVTSGLTPLAGLYLQAGRLEPAWALALLPLCVMQVAVSMAANFPDEQGDRMAGKRTLVVRLGRRSAARLYAALIVGSYLLLPLQAAGGLSPLVPLTVAVSAPLALWLAVMMGRGAWQGPESWDRLCFWTNGLTMSVVGLMFAALLWPGE